MPSDARVREATNAILKAHAEATYPLPLYATAKAMAIAALDAADAAMYGSDKKRNARLVAMHNSGNGMSRAQLAKHFCISEARVGQILRRAASV